MFGPGDGCTLWFDGVWRHCCDVHDIAYEIGADKAVADLELAVCVAKTGNAGMAFLMLLGLTLFGGIFHRRRR